MITNLDTSTFYFLYGLAGRSVFFDSLIIFFGYYFIFIVFAVFGYFAVKDFFKEGIRGTLPYIYTFTAALVSKFAVVGAFRIWLLRDRPYLALNLSHLLSADSNSFPSGHTITIFSMATAAYFYNKKLSYFMFVSGILVGFARIAGGVHYPSDILGGIILGILVGMIVYRFFTRFLFRNYK
jgi:undecaprenyl-diphosphatase